MPKTASKAQNINNKERISRIAKPKFQYSPAKVNLALNAILSEGMAVASASRAFNVPRTTLRNKISGKSPRESTHCGFDSYLGKEIEEELVNWILTCAKMGFPIDKDGLLTSVSKFVKCANIKTPFVNGRPGKKWYYSFLNRHKQLSQKKAEYIHRGRGAVTEEKIRKWFDEVQATLEEYNAMSVLEEPHRIFNMDETCFCLAPKSGRVIGLKGKHVYDERTASDKENVTTLFTVNAAGNFAPPLTIFKYERIPAAVAKSAPQGWGLGRSEKGWMTAECFFEYFSNVFLPFLKESKIQFPVVVFLDGHKSHLTYHLSKYCRENEIILVALLPNATHILQPLDVAVFGPLKTKWKNFVKKYKMDNNGNELSKSCIPMALSNLLKDSKMPSNIAAGFRATGLYPFLADAVDYSKIILRTCNNIHHMPNIDPEVANHLKYLEQKIDVTLLQEFKQTKKRNHEWEGKIEGTFLYNVWLEMSKDAETIEPSFEPNDRGEENLQLENEILTPEPNPTSFDSGNEGLLDAMLPSSSTVPDGSILNFTVSTRSSPSALQNPDEGSIVNTQHVETVKRNIFQTPQSSSSCLAILHDVVPYPDRKETSSKNKRKREYVPSVITSDKWVQYHEEKERIKKEKEMEKQQRKEVRKVNKQNKEEAKAKQRPKTSKPKTRQLDSASSSEEYEEWAESGSSGDDVDFLDNGDHEASEMYAPDDLKPGDFLLVRFIMNNKKRAVTYRYVASVLKIIALREFEIQCFKSLNTQKTEFEPIQNDISIIGKNDILGKLEDPIVEEACRKLKTIFPGPVDVYEKT